MRRLAFLVVAVAALGLLPETAHAQGYMGGFGGYSFDGAAGECPAVWHACQNHRTGYGVVFGSLSRLIGFEQEYSWTSNFFGEGGDLEGSKVTTLMTNMLVAVPIGPLRPYGAVGIGLMKAKMEFIDPQRSDFSDTSFGWDYGAGVILLLPAHIGFRFDYRFFRSSAHVPIVVPGPNYDNALQFTRASIALILH
jgi:opacity protein-like surface antigen